MRRLSAIVLVLAALWLWRGLLLAPLAEIVAERAIARAVHGTATIERASGDWTSHVRLDGVQVSSPGTLRRLAADTVDVRLRPRLYSGDVGGLRALRIDGLDLDVVLGEPTSAETSATTGWRSVFDRLPATLPALAVAGRAQVRLGTRVLVIDRLALNGSGDRLILVIDWRQPGDVQAQRLAAHVVRLDPTTFALAQPMALGPAGVAGTPMLRRLTLSLAGERPRLAAEALVGHGSLVIDADADGAQVTVRGLDLAALPPALHAFLPTALHDVAGRLDADCTATRGAAGWNGGGDLRIADLRLLTAGPLQVAAHVRFDADGLRIDTVDVSGPDQGRVSASAMLLTQAAAWRPHSGQVTVDIRDLRQWLPAMTVTPSGPLRLAVAANLQPDRLVLRRLALAGAGVELTGQGHVLPDPWRCESMIVRLSADLATLGTWIPHVRPAAGNVQLDINGAAPLGGSPWAWLAGPLRVQADGSGLSWSGRTLGALRLRAEAAAGTLSIEQAELRDGDDRLDLAGRFQVSATGWSARLERGEVSWSGVQARTLAAVSAASADGNWIFDRARVAIAGGEADIAAHSDHGASVLRVALRALDLARLGVPGLSGVADAEADLRGSPQWPHGTLAVRVPALSVAGIPGILRLALRQDAAGLSIAECQVEAGGRGRLHAAGTLPLALGSAGVQLLPDDGLPCTVSAECADLAQWLPSLLAGGAGHFELRADGPADLPRLTSELRLTGLRLRAPPDELPRRSRREVPAIDLIATMRGDDDGLRGQGALTIAGREALSAQASIAGRSRLGGSTLVSPDAAHPATPAWRQRPLSGEVRLDRLALESVAMMVPQVTHLSGLATGVVTVGGTLAAPELSGRLSASDVEAKLTPDVPTVTAGRIRLDLRWPRLVVEEIAGELGRGAVSASGEALLGGAHGIQVDLRVRGANALLYQRHDARLRADLAVRVQGPWRALSATGSATVTSALLSPTLEVVPLTGLGVRRQGRELRAAGGRVVLFEWPDPPLSDLRFDIAVTSAGDGVRLVTGLLDGICDIDLHLGGTGAAPRPTGRVVAREMIVTLPFSTLAVSHGEITFPPNDPYQPRVQAMANAHVRRHAVTVRVEGPLSAPQIEATGSGLDERDALLLLTTGSTSAELDDEQGRRAALARLGTWLGKETWRRVAGPDDPDAGPGLADRVSLEIGKEISDTGEDTVQAEFELTKPGGRRAVLLYGERDRFGDYNLGATLRFSWGGER